MPVSEPSPQSKSRAALQGTSLDPRYAHDPLAQIRGTPAPAAAPVAGGGVDAAYQDPAYLQFLRTLGVDEAQAKAQVANKLSGLTQDRTDMQPVYADKLRLGLKDIGDNALGRGMFRSGQRLSDQAQYQTDVARSQLGAQNDTALQGDALSLSLAKQIAEGRRSTAENAVDARNRVGQDNAQYGIA